MSRVLKKLTVILETDLAVSTALACACVGYQIEAFIQ